LWTASLPMLQIISGKFFTSDDRHRFEGLGILYSNVACWRPIVTPVATLHSVDPHGSVARYVVTYINQIEREAASPLARCGDAEIIEQFRLLMTFGLRGFFAAERREVEHVCRMRPQSSNDYAPSLIVDRFCASRIHADAGDMARCEALVRDVIGLRRRTYVATMAYLKNFVHALEAADTNIDLAYSMLMYGIEALSQQFGTFDPTWTDYEEKVRTRIDSLLSHDPAVGDQVRTALLQSKPVRIQQRAIAFVEEHLSDDFFEGEHLKHRKLPLRRSFVRRAIRNAYERRSKFVHKLERAQDLHASFSDYDTLTRHHEPFLTFRGLFRVAEQVVRHFITTQEKVDAEDIEWPSELPGGFTVELAPSYWIGNANTFQPSKAHGRLSAFLDQAQEALSGGGSVTDLRAVLLKIESLITKGSGSIPQRRATAALYVLYHTLVKPNPDLDRIKVSDDVFARCEELLKVCSMESLVTRLLLGDEFEWPREECAAVASAYAEQKFSSESVSLPAETEAALLAEVANMFLAVAADVNTASDWFRKARLELVGRPEKQSYLNTCAADAAPADRMRLLRSWTSEQP
jgi:hypothetical protein